MCIELLLILLYLISDIYIYIYIFCLLKVPQCVTKSFLRNEDTTEKIIDVDAGDIEKANIGKNVGGSEQGRISMNFIMNWIFNLNIKIWSIDVVKY